MKRTINTRYYLLALTSLAFVSCSTINSINAVTYGGKDDSKQVQKSSRGMGSYSLAKGFVKVTITKVVKKDKKGKVISVTYPTVVESIVGTDTENTFNVRLTRSWLADDSYEVKTDPGSQTLIGITNVHDDKSGAILEKVAETASAVLNPSASGVEALADRNTPNKISVVFDPFDSKSEAIKQIALMLGGDISLSIKGVSDLETQSLNIGDEQIDNTVFYRPVVKDFLQIKQNGAIIGSFPVTIPRNDLIMAMELKRKAFVKTEYTIEFEYGSPKRVKVVSPSQGLAIVSLPLKIAGAIIDTVPLELRFKSAQATRQANALGDQKKVLDAQKALLDSQKALLDAQIQQNNSN